LKSALSVDATVRGHLADEVAVELYQRTAELIDAFRKARDFARVIEQTEGTPQKLCFANSG